MRLSLGAAVLALLAGAAHAQLVPNDPDWKESEAPPPPAVRTQHLIPLDMGGSELRWGVDPASISVGADGIVRYVVGASAASGALNAMYEGLRCSTGEVKVYARHARDGGWVRATGDWVPVHSAAARHSLVIARTGACAAEAPNGPAPQIARDLAAPANDRFRNEVR